MLLHTEQATEKIFGNRASQLLQFYDAAAAAKNFLLKQTDHIIEFYKHGG